jgi:two-component system, LuxR family, response regulator FixJ
MATKPTIVVIDDNDGVRRSLRALLDSSNYAVADYPSAIAFLADGPHGDCLIVDVQMPQMSGLELQEELVRRGSTVPVIVVTGHADVPLAVYAMKAGAFDLIEKPFHDDALLDSIERALASGRATRNDAVEAKAADEKIGLLTDREHQVLEHLVLGQSNKIVAHELGISPRTVEIHRARIQEKMNAGGLSELVRIVRAAGIDLAAASK